MVGLEHFAGEQVAHLQSPGFFADEIAQGIGGVIATGAVLAEVGFEKVAGAIGIVLERREAGEQAAAARVKEQSGRDVGVRIPQALTDGGPTGDAVHRGGAQAEAEVAILLGDRIARAFAAEHVRARAEAIRAQRRAKSAEADVLKKDEKAQKARAKANEKKKQ